MLGRVGGIGRDGKHGPDGLATEANNGGRTVSHNLTPLPYTPRGAFVWSFWGELRSQNWRLGL